MRCTHIHLYVAANETHQLSVKQKSILFISSLQFYRRMHLLKPSFCSTYPSYRGADKSLARPGRKQATATEDLDVHIYNHNWRNISTIYIYNKTSIKRNILTIKQNTSGSRSGQGLISTPYLVLKTVFLNDYSISLQPDLPTFIHPPPSLAVRSVIMKCWQFSKSHIEVYN